MTTLRIAVVAGEASGDVLAAGMIRALRKKYPNAIIEGIGGHHMQAEGFTSLFDMETLSVMGLVEVLGRLPSILKLKRDLLTHFEQHPPDVYVGVDAPDFNLRIETALKSKGIPTIHYVSPTVWAWREKRIFKIAKAADLVMGVFPFEKQVYDKYKVPFTFVGHTLADAIDIQPDPLNARKQLSLSAETTYLGVLPGSRRREVATLLPVFIKTMVRLLEQQPHLEFVIPAANEYRYSEIENLLNNVELTPTSLRKKVTLVQGQSREVMIASNALLLASGTASLEGMLCKKPMVVAYKMSWLTHKIMQRLYIPRFFSLPNILANQELVPELLQEDVNEEKLSTLLAPWLQQAPNHLLATFKDLHTSLKCNADEAAAQAVLGKIADVEGNTLC
ncbi:lipid-A-disaccharide synthase [Alteromonas sp. 5E99-2]|nr:lipid-A-disaccharide synthase [Alteromonas sp. 5E99-2]MBO1254091.1 lipid-A-disaccharide synthase [Alteromonas sp. 5E99-2]